MKRTSNLARLRQRLCCAASALALTPAAFAPASLAAGADDATPQQSQIPTFEVTAPRIPFEPTLYGAPLEMTPMPAADGGDFLRKLPGVSGSRMGGHGIEPVIRGMQGNQINVTMDNAYIFGGCPNRMDPPTSFIAPETFDLIFVTQGYRTVTKGPGGPAGSVSFERRPPVFAPGEWYTGKVGAGVVSNGFTRDAFGDIAVGADGFYVRGIGNVKEADNYDDGGGNEIRSSFSHRSGDLIFGYEGMDGAAFSLSGGVAKTEDALFEGAMMDAPLDDSVVVSGKLSLPFETGLFRKIEAEAYVSQVDHVMDNYSLRVRTAPMAMRVDADSDTYGGRIAGDIRLDDVELTVGADLQTNDREARRFTGMTNSNVTTLQSIMWPGTEIRNIGLFVEGKKTLTDDLRLVVGARYDRVDVSLAAANEVIPASGRTPNDLYRQYYGVTGADREENNLGGLAFLEYDLAPRTVVSFGASRSVRTADATERSMASDQGPRSWVGNPGIDPEAHHQIEAGIDSRGDGWRVFGNVYADWVNDFIMRDTARGQDGILLSNGASVYRNVDALLTGFTVGGTYRFGGNWVVDANAAYTFGENLSDDQALAQIPPLEGMVTLTYEADGWSLGGTVRGALQQTRVDDDPATGSGVDVGETPGWVTLDLQATVDLVKPFRVQAGVTNLLDAEYANHLNRANAFDPTSVQVNEPGQSFYLRVVASF